MAEVEARQSLIDAVLELAKQIGCVSHSAVRYNGKREGVHVFWIAVEEYEEMDNVVWTEKEKVILTIPMRSYLTFIQEKAKSLVITSNV
jgi:hypothetical protein